jgi:hypothetical protein
VTEVEYGPMNGRTTYYLRKGLLEKELVRIWKHCSQHSLQQIKVRSFKVVLKDHSFSALFVVSTELLQLVIAHGYQRSAEISVRREPSRS